MTADAIVAMREWVAECSWGEDPEAIADLTDNAILRGVERHYHGGIAGFLADNLL